jgi:hypothetical protein
VIPEQSKGKGESKSVGAIGPLQQAAGEFSAGNLQRFRMATVAKLESRQEIIRLRQTTIPATLRQNRHATNELERTSKTAILICPTALGVKNAADIFISYCPARTHVANPSAVRGHRGEFFLIDRCGDALYFYSYLFACFSTSDLNALRHAVSISTTLVPHRQILQRGLSHIMAKRLGRNSCPQDRYRQ